MIARISSALAAAVLIAPAYAGTLADAFAPGFRGVAWGPGCSPDKSLPGGKWSKIGITRIYSVRDGSPVMGVARDARNELQFTCNTEDTAVAMVTITYPTTAAVFSDLTRKLTETFGPPPPADVTSHDGEAAFAALSYTWTDGDYTMALARFSTGLTTLMSLSIAKTATSPKTRQELGIQ